MDKPTEKKAAALGIEIKKVRGGYRLITDTGREPRAKILCLDDVRFWLSYWTESECDLQTWTPPEWVESP